MAKWIFMLALTSQGAFAADCGKQADAAVKQSGAPVVAGFEALLQCDKAMAEDRFGAFLRASGEVPVVVDLSLKAIDAQLYAPIWNMLDKVPDYPARAEIAQRVGGLCQEVSGVLPFLQGAYYAVGGRQFAQWTPAFAACGSEGMTAWMESEVVKPPARAYDEKYIALVDGWVARRQRDALPALERASVEAAQQGGPFSTLVEKLFEAAKPAGLGATPTEEDKAALIATLVRIGGAVPPTQAALVADRLQQLGAHEKAAQLLPSVWPERVQADGGLLYGVIAVESCGGDAVLHSRMVHEPAKRWSILDDVTRPARVAKARLKCTPDEKWPVYTTPEPIANDAAFQPWVESVVAQWEAQGLDVKERREKDLTLE